MNFLLTGRDQLSRVLDRAGDASDRLGRRLAAMSINSDAAVRRFTSNTTRNLAGMQRDTDAGTKALGQLRKTALLFTPAAIPVAASLAPIAAGAGTVAVAVAAMGAAIAPQIAQLGEASGAQKKYDDAVAKSGAHSQEAAKAQAELARVTAKLPPETRRAAAALAVLKDEGKEWSDSLAGDTMAPVTKGLMLTNALLPKTSGLVRAASGETDRFMTIVGGSFASPGFDSLNSKFTTFAHKTLRGVNDELVHLLRVSDGGQVGGQAREFMEWARAQGPTVASVLSSVAGALVNVLKAGGDVGVGLLQVVEVLADIVSAVPPSAIAVFLQLAIALKLTKAAALGLAAGRTAIVAFAAQVLAMNSAAAATPGRMAAARAAIAALSRTAKVAVAGTGIGLLLIALSELSQRSGQAPPDVDKLTGSLKQLGATGKVTGEAAKHFGSDLSGLHDKVRSLTDPSTTDKVQQFLVGWTGWDSTPVKDAKASIDAIDKSLAGLVQNGDADLAAAALKRLTAEYGKGGRDTSQFTKELGDYKSALADAKFEQELAAASMGVFGQQALSVKAKLDAQKMSADGLRESIMALNDTNRSAYDAQIGFESAVDSLTDSFKENGASLDISTEAGRKNGQAMSAAAKAHDEMLAAGLAAGESLGSMTKKSDTLRAEMMRLATATLGSKTKAEEYVNTLLGVPGEIATAVRLEKQEAVTGLADVQQAIARTPGAKTVTVSTLNAAAIKALESVGLKTKQLPDGKTAVFTANGSSLGNIAAVRRALDALDGKTAKTYTKHYELTVRETRAVYNTVGRPTKGEGGVSKYAGGGRPEAGEMAMVGENGPELVLFGEAAQVIDSTRTKAIMSGTLGAGRAAAQGLAVGLGSGGGVYAAARSMAAQVTGGIRDELEIRSPSKKTKALMADVGKGMVIGLTGTQAKIKATAKDLAKDIWTAFDGAKDNRLVAMVNSQTKKLLAAAAKRDKIAATIATAKKYAGEITSSAREGAGLGNLGMDADEVTAGGIKGGLASKLAQIKQFTTYIGILAKKGLNKGLLRQILNMGPEAGYAYASALVGADKNTFKSINSLQSQLDASTATLGRVGADKLYDSGKNATKGFLAGLSSQHKELEKAMEKIAKAMQTALRKALGIKSPATKMMPDGENTTKGVAVGVLNGLPFVDRAMDAVAGRMAGRAAVTPVAGRAAVVAGRGAGAVIHLNVDVGPATDPHAVWKAVREGLLSLKRHHGLAELGLA